MATLADFVGAWYFRGERTRPPCHIRLQGANRLMVTDVHNKTYPGRFDGSSTLFAEPPGPPGYFGVISSDLKRIEWTDGENWQR